MTPSQLRQWSFRNSQPDQWWLSLDSVTEEIPVTVAEIEERLKSGDYSTVQALHVSQADMGNAPWVEVSKPPVRIAPIAALSEFKPSETPGKSSGSPTKGQNVGCAALALGGLGLGFFFLVLHENHREETERTARSDELRWAKEREVNEKWNREHVQPQRNVRTTESASDLWYEGGTLSSGGATMEDWNRATYENRLASSADFVARSIRGNMGNLDMDDDIRPMAVRLELEISAAYQEGVTDKTPVHEIAAAIVIILKKHGQWLR